MACFGELWEDRSLLQVSLCVTAGVLATATACFGASVGWLTLPGAGGAGLLAGAFLGGAGLFAVAALAGGLTPFASTLAGAKTGGWPTLGGAGLFAAGALAGGFGVLAAAALPAGGVTPPACALARANTASTAGDIPPAFTQPEPLPLLGRAFGVALALALAGSAGSSCFFRCFTHGCQRNDPANTRDPENGRFREAFLGCNGSKPFVTVPGPFVTVPRPFVTVPKGVFFEKFSLFRILALPLTAPRWLHKTWSQHPENGNTLS